MSRIRDVNWRKVLDTAADLLEVAEMEGGVPREERTEFVLRQLARHDRLIGERAFIDMPEVDE